MDRFADSGVYYGATFIEAQLCRNEEVIVVGGGNSAGQAAVFLSQHAKHVHMVVRAKGLAETMSRYLVRRIEENSDITLHSETEITSVDGDGHLERVSWAHRGTGAREELPIRHIFVMCGAVPSTSWLKGCVVTDAKGFIKTGPAITAEELRAASWPLTRAPHSARDELARRVRSGRRARREREARRVSGGGGVDISIVRASGAPGIADALSLAGRRPASD